MWWLLDNGQQEEVIYLVGMYFICILSVRRFNVDAWCCVVIGTCLLVVIRSVESVYDWGVVEVSDIVGECEWKEWWFRWICCSVIGLLHEYDNWLIVAWVVIIVWCVVHEGWSSKTLCFIWLSNIFGVMFSIFVLSSCVSGWILPESLSHHIEYHNPPSWQHLHTFSCWHNLESTNYHFNQGNPGILPTITLPDSWTYP